MVVSPFREIDVEHAPHETTVNDPDVDAGREVFPERQMDAHGIREVPPGCQPRNVPGILPPLAELDTVRRFERIVVRHPLCHQGVFHEKVVDEEPELVGLPLPVDPEFALGDEPKP